MSIAYPQVYKDSKNRVFVSFYINNKRYRLYNGKRIGSNISPNTFPMNQRYSIGNLLAAEVYKYVSTAGEIKPLHLSKKNTTCFSYADIISQILEEKLNQDLSNSYKKTLKFVGRNFIEIIGSQKVHQDHVKEMLGNYQSNTSYNTVKKHLAVLLNEAEKLGLSTNPISLFKAKKSKAILNKPFQNVEEILDDIFNFNRKLHLCCLLTYGCLLRPHREVRELKWVDFTNDLTHIRLSGQRNKSGRNRIVPVPLFIKNYLIKNQPHLNIFSNNIEPHNPDFFKTLWSRYKKQSKLIEDNQTLYSFRHTGAINIYQRTGSLSKLQQAMGHSSLNVSLTYLRGLEVGQLTEEDMPLLVS